MSAPDHNQTNLPTSTQLNHSDISMTPLGVQDFLSKAAYLTLNRISFVKLDIEMVHPVQANNVSISNTLGINGVARKTAMITDYRSKW